MRIGFAQQVSIVALSAALVGCGAGRATFDANTYGDLLQRYTPDGKVDYAELKKNDVARLETLYRGLANFDASRFPSPDAELAFWMNAYNVIVLYSATKAFPVKEVWGAEKEFFKVPHVIGGKTLSLDDIEHKQIRERFRDARFHFGVNCGSTSCPLLSTKPYTAENLQEKLNLNARMFIDNDANVRFDEAKGELHLSEMFKWYAADFVHDAGSVEKFLAKYLPTEK